MGPIAGIVVSDFYLIRDKKLDIRDMYNPDGIYRYYHGWNWRAWLVFFIAVGPILPGFAQSINPNLSISAGAEEIYTFSWMWGFFSCLINYYILCKYIAPPTASLIDVPVFPPRTEEEEEAQRAAAVLVGESGSPESGSTDKFGEKIETKLEEKV
jgi:nucleobase:cation symporter-1, NCS1 family